MVHVLSARRNDPLEPSLVRLLVYRLFGSERTLPGKRRNLQAGGVESPEPAKAGRFHFASNSSVNQLQTAINSDNESHDIDNKSFGNSRR